MRDFRRIGGGRGLRGGPGKRRQGMGCFLDDLRAFGINADQWTTAAQDEGEWRRTELFNDWGGRGYNDSVPGEVTKTAPSRDRITGSPTLSGSLPQIQLIPPGSWSDMSPVGAFFVPSPPKTETNLLHPLSPQSLHGSTTE